MAMEVSGEEARYKAQLDGREVVEMMQPAAELGVGKGREGQLGRYEMDAEGRERR